jgi:glycosidase
MKTIPRTILVSLFILLATLLYAQVVTTDPPYPLVDQPVTVIFDATQGDGGLAGFTGDIYAHTGLITEFSGSGSDWKYVKADWGVNIPDCKMTKIGTDLYELEITPDIIDYYGAPGTEKILQMAFVFRSATQVGGQWVTGRMDDGGDIFIDVFEAGLNVTFLKPFSFPVIAEPEDTFAVEVAASESDSLWLYVGDELVKKAAGTYLIDTITATTYGKYMVRAVAGNAQATAADTFYYYVRKPVEIAALPAGIRDGVNYPGPETAVLSLVAPGKEYIYVIGDFNDWEVDSNYYMKMTPDGERFWLEIDDLIPGKEYIFQYFIDGTLRVGDPYADKVSDPWNDSYISDVTYPGLIQYPAGKTFGIATVLQTDQQAYDWEVENFTPPAVTDLIIYELLVRDFTEEHSYQAVIDSLDYLQRLGVNAIELMPVNEFEGNISWGYNPSFYFAPDKYYGPKDKLKELIDECHKRGMAVIIDLVLNHAYDQCPLVQMYFDGDNPTEDNPWFNVQSNFTNTQAQWGNDFNHESPYTQDFVDSVNSYWMTEYKVDGFRFDFTKGFGNNIKGPNDPWGSLYDADRIALLKRMADEIWERNPNALVILEHLAVNTEDKELADYGMLMWGNMSGAYGEAAMGWHDNNKSDFSGISYKTRNWNDPHLIGYMESHDEERLMYKCITWGNGSGDYQVKDTLTALERMQLNAVFFLTVPGPKMIWQFGEYGYDISIDSNGRTGPKPVLWNYLQEYQREYLYKFYGALINLRAEHPVFRTTDFNLFVNGVTKRIFLYHEDMNVIVIGNFGVTETNMQVTFPGYGTYYNYFTGDSLVVDSIFTLIALQPGEYRLYTNEKLETPQIGTGIWDGRDTGRKGVGVLLFPNPARDRINYEIITRNGKYSGDRLYFDIYNGQGRRIFSRAVLSNQRRSGVDISGLSEGVYFVRLADERGVISSGKFIKIQ